MRGGAAESDGSEGDAGGGVIASSEDIDSGSGAACEVVGGAGAGEKYCSTGAVLASGGVGRSAKVGAAAGKDRAGGRKGEVSAGTTVRPTERGTAGV